MGGGHGGDGHGTTYKGFTVHHPKRWHVLTGKGMCAIMWFWVLYRAKQDGPVVLVSICLFVYFACVCGSSFQVLAFI
uniref:NADH dehydrogenase [ubiquinone] 1 beta subcomplex subunit 2 n=1 Tax=Nelumbo nucifera TaxID=4432 RepID=A0A822ZP70_NELNU|nr:TPA_asm: hypothetical protein HUJ06_016540 [Nelumbo nucifera]